MSQHVFISYARKDGADFARQLHDDLEKMGLNMWLDVEDIPKGANWALTIQRAIMTCRAFIFVITPGSYESEICNKELAQARDSGIPILPVYHKVVETLPFLLIDVNYTDCSDESKIEAGFKALFDEINKTPAGEATPDSEIFVPESVRAGANQAKLYTDSDDVDFIAEAGLFGRDELQKQIQSALSANNARVLLQAFGGVGKTALAAEMSADWIDEKSENVLWLEIGASDSEAAFEALAQPFGASKAMAATPVDEKAKLLRNLIKAGNIGLVVLDDCWNGQSLLAIQKAIPRKVPLLVTARQRYPLTPIFAIPDLPQDEALALLRKLAPTLMQDDNAAKALCQKLGYHAFALEVAGRTMQANSYTAQKLLSDIENTDITQLQVPLDYQKAGRESIAALIETTLNELPEEAKKVFLAWGAFFSARITPELMASYLSNVGTTSMSSEESLNLLQQYGLATRQHATQTAEGRPLQVASYKLHDLAFEYARAQNSDDTRNCAVDACLTHIKRHKETSLENFAALDPDIDTFMAAANFAMSQGRYAEVERFAWDLYANETPQILVYRGYYSLATTLLQQSADAAGKAGSKQNQGAHLGNLGNAYDSLGQYQQAIDYHQQALTISREIGDKRGEGSVLGNLGNAYFSLGQYQQAIEYHQQALAISREIGNQSAVGSILGNLGTAYRNLGQYQQAIEYHQQALAIAEEIGDVRGKGNRLGNLGNAYFSLGQYQQAIEYYTQALAIAEEIGDVRGKGNQLGNLGIAYSNLGQYQQAIEYHQQALAIAEEISDVRNKGNWLGNLGNAYRNLGQYEKSIEYMEQVLEIFREMGNKQGEGNALGNLGIAYSNLGQYEQAIDYQQQALAISREIGDKSGESNRLNNLGVDYEKLEDYDKAIAYYEQSLVIRRELGNPHLIEQTERNLERARGLQAGE